MIDKDVLKNVISHKVGNHAKVRNSAWLDTGLSNHLRNKIVRGEEELISQTFFVKKIKTNPIFIVLLSSLNFIHYERFLQHH
jgi:hypothetical protein